MVTLVTSCLDKHVLATYSLIVSELKTYSIFSHAVTNPASRCVSGNRKMMRNRLCKSGKRDLERELLSAKYANAVKHVSFHFTETLHARKECSYNAVYFGRLPEGS